MDEPYWINRPISYRTALYIAIGVGLIGTAAIPVRHESKRPAQTLEQITTSTQYAPVPPVQQYKQR